MRPNKKSQELEVMKTKWKASELTNQVSFFNFSHSIALTRQHHKSSSNGSGCLCVTGECSQTHKNSADAIIEIRGSRNTETKERTWQKAKTEHAINVKHKQLKTWKISK